MNIIPFDKIIQFTLRWEGGSKYTNDPDDLGAATRFGISQRAHPEVDIEHLTEEEAKDIYYNQYWLPIAAGQDDDLDMTAFDSCVNMGVSRVKGWLHSCDSWQDLISRRRQYYARLIKNNPNMAKYKRGWENRVSDLEGFISQLNN